MSVFEKVLHIDPKYQHFQKFVDVMYNGLWIPSKYQRLIEKVDAPYFFNEMGDIDQECIRRCTLAVVMVEDKVKLYWVTVPMDLPQTIFGDIGGLFGQSEVTHRISYHSLAEVLGIDTEEVENHPVLRDRIKYLTKYLEKDPKIIGKRRILKKLVLFTALVERCSLFTQFYILMSYNKHKRGLPTISALQKTTAKEEDVHYSFGVQLIKTIKKEHPELWNEYLVELIEKNIQMAYESERNLIDWFFEKGVPEHLTKEEVINFLNYNFNTVNRHLELGLDFSYDEELYREKNEWFSVATKSPVNPDFFDNAVGDYSTEEEEIDVNNFNF